MPHFGLRYDLRLAPFSTTSRHQLYATALEQIEWADRLGFGSVALHEHHGMADGYLPSPAVFAGAVAARTRSIGITVTIPAPLHDPVRLAEDLAVVDHLSAGRLRVVLGNGYVDAESLMFGKEPLVAARVKATSDALVFLRHAWTDAELVRDGQTIRVTPRPYQAPHPPIGLAGYSRGAARRAARLADFFHPGDVSAWLWDIYREELARLGRPDPGPMAPLGPFFLHISAEPEQSWDRIGAYLLHEMNEYGRLAEAAGIQNAGDRTVASLAALRETGLYAVKTPDECVEIFDALGRDGVQLFHPLCGGIDPQTSWDSLRLFEHEVLPRLAR